MNRNRIVVLGLAAIVGGLVAACDANVGDVPNPLTDDGVYLVGTDIEPGTYAVKPDGDTAYWARCSAVDCNALSVDNPTVILNSIPAGPEFLVIDPTDVAVELRSVTLEGPK